MTDLVKRLRYAANRARKEYPEVFCVSEELAFEAADRIEQLEAALREIRAMHWEGGVNDLQERDDKTYCIVCDALEGKDD